MACFMNSIMACSSLSNPRRSRGSRMAAKSAESTGSSCGAGDCGVGGSAAGGKAGSRPTTSDEAGVGRDVSTVDIVD